MVISNTILFNMKVNRLFLFVVVYTVYGCGPEPEEIIIPEKFQNLENLTAFSPDVEPMSTFSFEKDAVYGETDDLMIGNMGHFAVDKLGQVYIADTRIMVLNVFDSDGNYIKRLGGEGRGPGEFNYLREVLIRGDYLYAFDPSPSRVHIFDTNTLEGINTVILGENRGDFSELGKTFPWIDGLFVRNDGTFLAKYISHTYDVKPWENIEVAALLYHVDQSGSLIKEIRTYMSEIRTVFGLVYNIEPFFSKMRVIMSNDNRFYVAEPDYFLIKQFSESGEYERSFYYPLDIYSLTVESALKSTVPERIIDNMHNMDLPEFWPVVTKILIDDQDQLWVATTVADFNIYEWFVVETSGELVARFDWPRIKPIEYVANGNIFTKETDEDSGLQQIVRYRIVIE
ncbi:MAG TPA: hypothetical protein DCE78_04420 [Bacteroidetes bacterium]|nr:hypothetical protein [Bacteroidota bacterium]